MNFPLAASRSPLNRRRNDRVETVEHECDEEKFEEGFEGDVTIDHVDTDGGYTTGWWVCPQCGVEREWIIDREYDGDPDREPGDYWPGF